jgi:RHS repeat-associated protein
MTSDVSHTFQYDAEGRLAEGTNPTQAFVYNALGQRVVWGDAYFAVDPEGRHVAQWDGWLNAYAVSGVFRLGGQMIGGYYDAYTPANDTWMIHRNVLGSTSMVTDHAGTEISDVADYPWGDVWIADASKEYHFAGFNYRFSALGIDPAINREYEYGLGRWLSPDPLGGDVTNPQSLNRYAYVLNNPTSLTDPLGLDPRACQDPAYADSHAECRDPGSSWCSEFPYDPSCSGWGYPSGSGGNGSGRGGGGGTVSSAPPAGQPPLAGGLPSTFGNPWVSNTFTAPGLYCYGHGGIVPGLPGNASLPCFVIQVTTDAKALETLSKAVAELDHLSSRYVTLPYFMVLSGTVVAGTAGVAIGASLAAGPEGWVLLPVEGAVFVGGVGLAVEGIDYELTGHFSLLDRLNRSLNPVPAH